MARNAGVSLVSNGLHTEPSEDLVLGVTSRLRERILSIPDEGVLLGSTSDLLAQFGVSRPTLRRAVQLLEQEQLMTVRRGVNGGYFTRRPSPEAVARIASIYLRSQQASNTDVMHALGAIGGEAARLAAESDDDEGKFALRSFVETYQTKDRRDEPKWFFHVVVDFDKRLAALSESVTLKLFMDVLTAISALPSGARPFAAYERREMLREYHRDVSDAICRGDADAAEAVYRRQYFSLMQWREYASTR